VFLENLKQLLAADMAAVDQVIRTRLHSEVLLVNQVGEYIVNSGGKRLRPALVVLSAEVITIWRRWWSSFIPLRCCTTM
jgi:octaprenyl-diphosphate synthase